MWFAQIALFWRSMIPAGYAGQVALRIAAFAALFPGGFFQTPGNLADTRGGKALAPMPRRLRQQKGKSHVYQHEKKTGHGSMNHHLAGYE